MDMKTLKGMLKGGKRPADMGYDDYKSLCKGAGEDPMSEDDYMGKAEDAEEEEEEEDEDGEEDEAEKSESVGADALSKALTDYNAVEDALSVSGQSRQNYLEARLTADTITKSERAELGGLWAGTAEGPVEDTEIRKSMSDHLADADEDAASLVDASDFLKSLVDSVDASLDNVHTQVTRESLANRELIKSQGSLVKALVEDAIDSRKLMKSQARVIAALAGRLGIVERQPAPRRSAGNYSERDIAAREINKSAAAGGPPANDDRLQKSQVLAGLTGLMVAASEANDDQAMDRISNATAKFEQFGTLDSNIETAVRRQIGAA